MRRLAIDKKSRDRSPDRLPLATRFRKGPPKRTIQDKGSPELYEAIADWHERAGIPLVLVELTLHSRAVAQLDDIGNLRPRYEEFLADFVRRRRLAYIDAPSIARITDDDFRDPAHIFRKREEYTQAIIDGVASAVASKSTAAARPAQG